MTAKTRVFSIARPALAVAILLSSVVLVASAASLAATVTVLTPESLHAYEQQLEAGQVTATVFNIKGRDIHVTLANGKHMLVHYGSGERNRQVELAKAKGLTPVNGKGQPVGVTHHKHKLRYIAGGVVIVVIVIAGVVIYVRRKRRAADRYATDY